MRALLWYLRTQVWPRRAQIALQGQTALALLAGALVAVAGDDLALDDLDTDKFVTAVFAYAALALGACLTGLTVALTLPDRSFAEHLVAQEKEDDARTTAYGDLVFVFSWTALAHWVVIAAALVTIAVVGDQDLPTLAGDCSIAAALVVLLVTLLVYAMVQFGVTIITLSQVATVYIIWIRREADNHDAATRQTPSPTEPGNAGERSETPGRET